MNKENNEMYGFVYMTTNTINGKRYIGQRKYYKGWRQYLGSGVVLNRAIKKYGRDSFTRIILCECKNKEELNEKEECFISLYNAVKSDMFYNTSSSSSGGYGVMDGKTDKEKQIIRQKISESKKKNGASAGENNPMYGKTHSQEVKDKLSERNRLDNPMWNEASKEKLRKRMTGENNPMYGKKGLKLVVRIVKYQFL